MGDRFVGRVEALWELHDLLFKEDVAVVSGIGVIVGTGGLGKTQLAIEYVRRFGYLHEGGVWWVEADQGLGALIALVSEAADVTVDGRLPEPQQAAQLWDALRGRPASLLVLDNFPEDGNLESYLPLAATCKRWSPRAGATSISPSCSCMVSQLHRLSGCSDTFQRPSDV